MLMHTGGTHKPFLFGPGPSMYSSSLKGSAGRVRKLSSGFHLLCSVVKWNAWKCRYAPTILLAWADRQRDGIAYRTVDTDTAADRPGCRLLAVVGRSCCCSCCCRQQKRLVGHCFFIQGSMVCMCVVLPLLPLHHCQPGDSMDVSFVFCLTIAARMGCRIKKECTLLCYESV